MYKESETLELKREVTPNIVKEVIAFANTKGGTIYIGYDDDCNLIGVENAKEELDRISNMIFDSVDPKLVFNISMEIIEQEGKDIIVVKVLKGTNRPYYLKSKGMTPEGVFIRLGATNKSATRDDIVKMMMEDAGVKFEDNISKNQQLTFNAFKREFEERDIVLDNVKMQKMGLITQNNEYTNLAYIVSDQNAFPIKIAVYKGNDKAIFLDRKEFDNMSVFEQLREIEIFFRLAIKIPSTMDGFKRVDNPQYDFDVIRESIVNSIVHRDYEVYGSTLINIYEDSIEIVNLGGLVGGLTVEAIKRGSSATRNPKLASIFHRLNYIEAYGSGIPRILSKYNNQEDKPTIEVTENSFFVTFPKLQSSNDEILKYLEINGKISREGVEEILKCSKTTALRNLNKYVEEGKIRKVSVGKETYYELNQ